MNLSVATAFMWLKHRHYQPAHMRRTFRRWDNRPRWRVDYRYQDIDLGKPSLTAEGQ